MSKLRWILGRIRRTLWVRVVLYAVLGVLAAGLASVATRYLDWSPPVDVTSDAIDSLLSVIASSMLAVTTFSMSILVGAYGSATSNATPRAVRLLEGDKTAQTAVSVFMGSFMFAIVGIVCLAAELYSDQGRVLLFVATLVDIAVIASALLRWVNHLNDFGRMSDIIDRIERASLPAARLYRDRPSLGCVPRPLEETETTVMLKVQKSGYVKFVDMNRLQTVASAEDLHVEVLRMPGKYVHEGEALLRLSRPASEKSQKLLREAFSLGESRAFDQDLFYGMIVLGEVASKALSPGINDPGTAIEVLRAGTRVLRVFHGTPDKENSNYFDRVHTPPIDVHALYRTFFAAIARDGAGLIEVQETVQDSLSSLETFGDPAAARIEAARARKRASDALDQEWEQETLRNA